MDHEEAALLLDDLRLGRLTHEQQRILKRHLADCADCRALSAAHEVVLTTLREEGRMDEHPSTALLVDHAVEPALLDAASRERIEDHLRACRVCEDAVKRTRAVDRVARAERRTAGSRIRPWARYAMAASVAALMLLIAADIAIRLNRPNGEWTGNVGVTVLSGSVRDAASAVTLPLRDGQPYVLLAVDLDVAVTRLGPGAVEFVIRRENGDVVWTSTLPVDRVRRDAGASGLVAFLVPARGLSRGSYDLTVRQADPATPLLQLGFRVDRLPRR